jgi:hypothetical protein
VEFDLAFGVVQGFLLLAKMDSHPVLIPGLCTNDAMQPMPEGEHEGRGCRRVVDRSTIDC